MKCFYHPSENAVGNCQSCGKAMCQSCAAVYSPITCTDCAVASAKTMTGNTNKTFLLPTLIGLAVFIILFRTGMVEIFKVDPKTFFMLLFAFMGFGSTWTLTGKIMNSVFQNTFFNVWTLIPIKFALSITLGFIVFPINLGLFIFKNIKNKSITQKVNKMSEDIMNTSYIQNEVSEIE